MNRVCVLIFLSLTVVRSSALCAINSFIPGEFSFIQCYSTK